MGLRKCVNWHFRVCTGLSCQGEIATLLHPESHWEKGLSVGESGTVVPLLTSAAAVLGVPPMPVPAMLHIQSFP